jgi:hypothetical protein
VCKPVETYCDWSKFGGFVSPTHENSVRMPLDKAQHKCIELGPLVCRSISCDRDACTISSVNVNEFKPFSGGVALVPEAICFGMQSDGSAFHVYRLEPLATASDPSWCIDELQLLVGKTPLDDGAIYTLHHGNNGESTTTPIGPHQNCGRIGDSLQIELKDRVKIDGYMIQTKRGDIAPTSWRLQAFEPETQSWTTLDQRAETYWTTARKTFIIGECDCGVGSFCRLGECLPDPCQLPCLPGFQCSPSIQYMVEAKSQKSQQSVSIVQTIVSECKPDACSSNPCGPNEYCVPTTATSATPSKVPKLPKPPGISKLPEKRTNPFATGAIESLYNHYDPALRPNIHLANYQCYGLE